MKILLANPQLEIRPGFFARATLKLAAGEQGLVVPKDAVVMRGTAAHVVVGREGKAVIVPVMRGAAVGDAISVSGELKEGEQVVVRGNEALRGGEMLMPAGGPPPAGTQPGAK